MSMRRFAAMNDGPRTSAGAATTVTQSTTIPSSGTASSKELAAQPGGRRADFWAIVLAGGEGVRLRSLVRRALGDDRPKQYARLLGDRSLLGQTLDRVSLGIPIDRTVVVT